MSLRFDIDEIQSEVERLIRRCPIGNLIEIAEELKIFNVDLESPIKIRRLIAEAFDEIESPCCIYVNTELFALYLWSLRSKFALF